MGHHSDDNWADKYKASHHHTDRVAHTKVEYETVTGVDYPGKRQESKPPTGKSNKDMAWGKGGSTNVVQVTTRSRRAYSVPAADVSYQPVGGRTASHVNYAKADADSISSASRRQDQRLLNDITSRLANAQFRQPAPPVRESRSRRRSRPVPSAPGSRRGSVSSIYSSPLPRKPMSMADEDFEIKFPPELKATAPCMRRAQNRNIFQRSASLPPPQTPKTQSRGGSGLIDLGSPLFRVVDGGPAKKTTTYSSFYTSEPKTEPMASPWAIPPPPPPAPAYRRRYSFSFEAPEASEHFSLFPPKHDSYINDSYIYRSAMSAPYVRRYIPLPQRTPFTYYGQNDYKPAPVIRTFRASSEPRRTTNNVTYTPSSSLAMKQARACLGRIERELGMGSVGLDDDAPYIDEPVVTTTTIHPVRASRTGFVRSSGAGLPPRRASASYGVVSSRPPVGPSVSRRHEIEARLETMIVPEPPLTPASYNSLRSRTTEARNKLDQHGRMLDRYLPVPSGVPNEVPYEVEYRFKELADRMPQLQQRERVDVSRATSLPPYRPISTQANKGPSYNTYNDALRTQPFRPKMSDTRKRAREVLCRTKRDPHYFDY